MVLLIAMAMHPEGDRKDLKPHTPDLVFYARPPGSSRRFISAKAVRIFLANPIRIITDMLLHSSLPK